MPHAIIIDTETTDPRLSRALLVDGPISVYLYPATSREILEALERLLPLIRLAALDAQKEHNHGAQR